MKLILRSSYILVDTCDKKADIQVGKNVVIRRIKCEVFV